jgi:hypothetical protein
LQRWPAFHLITFPFWLDLWSFPLSFRDHPLLASTPITPITTPITPLGFSFPYRHLQVSRISSFSLSHITQTAGSSSSETPNPAPTPGPTSTGSHVLARHVTLLSSAQTKPHDAILPPHSGSLRHHRLSPSLLASQLDSIPTLALAITAASSVRCASSLIIPDLRYSTHTGLGPHRNTRQVY